MHAVPRAALVAFGWWLATSLAGAQTESWPAIFAPPTRKPTVVVPPRSRPSAISDHMRQNITEYVLANAAAFEPPDTARVLPPTSGKFGETPLLMNRVLVEARPIRVIEDPRRDPPVLDFLKTGTLYHHVGPSVTTDITLNFLPIQATGYGSREATTRVELRFSFKW